MKKTILLLLIIASTFFSRVSAQQLPLYSQYMFNPYMLNSAICGTTEESQLKLNYRDQFSGFGNGSYNMQIFGIDPTPKQFQFLIIGVFMIVGQEVYIFFKIKYSL